MKNLFTIILIASTSLFACKTQSGAMGADNINTATVSGINDNNPDDVFDILVSFTSMGAGIDYEAKKKVDNIIDDFNTKNNTNITPEKIHWGKEGEVDYGFKLKNLSTKQKKQLSAKLKAIVGSSNITFMDFNKKCVHKR